MLLTLVVFGACGSEAPTSDGTADRTPASEDPDSDSAASGSTLNPVAGSWTLEWLTVEGDMDIDFEGFTPTIEIQGNTITGTTGCNTFGGTTTYDIAGDSFSVEVAEITEEGCDENIEEYFVPALESATIFTSEPGVLLLSDGAEFPTEMRFVIVPAENDPTGE